MKNEQQLENELGGYCPVEPSLRLQQAIAAELNQTVSPPAFRRWWGLWLAAGCAATACLFLMVAFLCHEPRGTGTVPPEQSASARLTPEQVKALPPTEWGYARAAESSQDDLVMFLEHQADVLLPNIEKDGTGWPHGT